MAELQVQYIDPQELKPFADNPRHHSERNIQDIQRSIKKFGFTNPILVRQEDNMVVAGHGRLESAQELGLEEVPVIYLDFSENDAKLYAITDNRTAETSEWDLVALDELVQSLEMDEDELPDTGFYADELEEILAEVQEDVDLYADKDADAVPEVTEAITQEGDLWILGEHRLLCGDATKKEDVGRLMDGQKAELLHADPPYGMGKESEGIANDNLYREKLDAFQMEWWKSFRPYLEDNGSAYIWGNAEDLWRLWYQGLKDSERLTFRNEIIWDKGHGLGMESERHRMYPTASERLLFFMLGEQGFNNNADNYWEGWDSVVNYLKEEKKKSGLTIKDFKRIAGHSENSGCHWFDKSQWMMPTEETYKSWQNYCKNDAFKKDYDDLKKDYDDLKKDFYATRAYFDNTHDNMTDVWQFERVKGEERHGHATPKPVQMIERIIKSSSHKKVIEPFLGSGSTLIACEKTNRKCYGMEIEPHYCDVTVQRYADFVGATQDTTLIREGRELSYESVG